MLIFHVTLLVLALSSSIKAGDPSKLNHLSPTLLRSNREIVEYPHNVPSYKHLPPKGSNANVASNPSLQNENIKSLSYYKDVKPVALKVQNIGQNKESNIPTANYQGIFKQTSPYADLSSPIRQSGYKQSNEHTTTPSFDNLFTVTGDYKVANGQFKQPPQLKQINGQSAQPLPKFQIPYSSNQNSGINRALSGNIQIPVYKTNYALPKASESLQYAPTFEPVTYSAPSFRNLDILTQNSPYSDATDARKVSLSAFQLPNNGNVPSYLHTIQSQPLVLSPTTAHLSVPNVNFASGAVKSNIVSSNTPFLSPLSSFQGQVVPIQTPSSSPQFPHFKGASIQSYPSVDALTKKPIAYESLQTQPLLHFGNQNVQPVQPVKTQESNSPHHYTPAEEIRSDVEIINKKKPTPPTPSKDDDDNSEEIDEGYKAIEKEYGQGAQDDDFEHGPEKYFQESHAEGDFKPSKAYPFQKYDEVFGKYSQQNFDKSEDEPLSKYHDYSSSNDDDNSKEKSSSKYSSESTAPGHGYGSSKEDEETQDSKNYEKRQKADDHSDYGYEFKPQRYYTKDFEHEFEESYQKEIPKQKYVHVKEVPEIEYPVTTSSRKSKNNDKSGIVNGESEEQRAHGTRTNYKYHKTPRTYKDNDGYNAKPSVKSVSKVVYEDAFRYQNPNNGQHSRNTRSIDWNNFY